MTQEVQVTLTLEVDATKSKEDIKRFFLDMEETYTRTVSSKNRWGFPKITLVDVKEEAEIYGLEEHAETKEFPNGFTSWQETHFEVVDFITSIRRESKIVGVIGEIQERQGTGGIWELAEAWTEEFEELHKNEKWEEKDFYEEVEKFCVFKNEIL